MHLAQFLRDIIYGEATQVRLYPGLCMKIQG